MLRCFSLSLSLLNCEHIFFLLLSLQSQSDINTNTQQQQLWWWWWVLKFGGRMGNKPPPPPPLEEQEEKKKKKEEIKSSPSSSSSPHDDGDDATNIETLVGDLQNLSLNNNNSNQLQLHASDQDHVRSSTNETLEGGELQNHPIISSEEEKEGSGETLEGEFQNLVHDCSTITTTTTTNTIETTLDGELLNLSSEEGKENQRDHKPPDDDDDDDIKTQTQTQIQTLVDGELRHNLNSSEWNETPQKDNDHPTTIETLDGELHNPEVETNPSSEWDNLHNPEVETNLSSEWDGWEKDNPEMETNLTSEWDGWNGTTHEEDNPEVETNLTSEWVDGTQKEDKPEGGETMFKQEEETRRVFQYPLRPEEPDCVFYLRTGSCRYGFHCKFNHPPRKKHQHQHQHQLKASSHLSESSVQRVEPIPAFEVKEKEREREDYTEWTGKIECKYYRTPGGCKFGKACRYYHPQEKNVVGPPPTEFNFLGLPIRPGEKECPFFMRTGSCKFATGCRFHHPDPTDAVESDPLSGYHDAESVELHSEGSPQPHVTSWSLPGTYNEASPYMDTSSSYPTGTVSPSQTHHNREWNGYQVPVRYSPEGNRNPQSASLMNHSTRKANNSMHQQQQMVVDEFPERPGQHECQYYMKHGDCKYRSACRFHHPKKYSTNSPVLSSIGLPLRPDQIICSNYSRFGICKYGPSCKYDHPAYAS